MVKAAALTFFAAVAVNSGLVGGFYVVGIVCGALLSCSALIAFLWKRLLAPVHAAVYETRDGVRFAIELQAALIESGHTDVKKFISEADTAHAAAFDVLKRIGGVEERLEHVERVGGEIKGLVEEIYEKKDLEHSRMWDALRDVTGSR